jgi:hypothetical protein
MPNIKISPDAYRRLKNLKEDADTFSEVILRELPRKAETFGDLEEIIEGKKFPVTNQNRSAPSVKGTDAFPAGTEHAAAQVFRSNFSDAVSAARIRASLSMRIFLFLLTIVGLEAAPLFRDFIGLNAHTVQFKPELYAPVANLVRDYHPVEWDLGKDSDFVTPFPFARNRVNWETVYGSWRKSNWRIDVSLMFETLPRDQWKNLAADSRAYAERFARAFGPSSKTPLVETVEIGNEPGKFNDADYRIVFENMARGFRAADPKIRIATCNLTTGKSHDYAKSVDCIAGLEDLYDILNIHTYAELEGWPTWRRSFPEDPKLKKYLQDIRNLSAWRDQHAPGKPIWITEFGYDATTKRPDPKTEFKDRIGNVTDEQQAQFLVRSFFAFAELPIDRAYIYFFNDSDTPQLHGASGLTRNFEPKPAFYAVAHLRKTLADFRWKNTLNMGPAKVAIFEHEEERGRQIWAAWLPTGTGAETELVIRDAKIQKIERMPLRTGEDVTSAFSGKLIVTESPVYLFLEK